MLGGQLADNAAAGSPVRTDNLRWRWPPAGLGAEIRSGLGRHRRGFWSLRVVAKTLLHWLLDRWHLRAGAFVPQRYREELRHNSDFRRFDDMLRLLVDCSEEQADQIERWLQARATQGRLNYGLHRADRALMTCMVFDLSQGEHVHFVDGADGGFALAARELKRQLAQC
jgi:hypothetical protein